MTENQKEIWTATTIPYKELRPSEKREIRLLAQGPCPICGRDMGDLEIHIDHDHETGYVRGTLCARCNVGLGQFEDDHELLLKAACYVLAHKAGLTDIRIGYRLLFDQAREHEQEWKKRINQEAKKQLWRAKQQQNASVEETIPTVETAVPETSTSNDSEVSKQE